MIYNLDKINELAEGDNDFIMAVVGVFLEEVPQDLAELEVALRQKNFESVYKLAHKIKPNVDLLGMEDTRKIALNIETLGKKGKSEEAEITRLVPLLKEDINQVVSELKNDFSF
ncbi:HPt (histidine-containing phosphotransfer) domain-containing protein [Arenibacter nanhaiticus]|uniref:HPt (Histidine-containing phosphotransfer) domain-containing protein n=1 Tax=Arenibacter nanhaiticus TaxID=558155 RepID=A0A1M6ICA9_9FLAO|nr:Hpt domain-containing protein [Arenibacter nanhaiticus]SHJ32043.1 HPt (histidine-containing phosphotransfer) domain-containing protein [Arenibacter nanhaiticus]